VFTGVEKLFRWMYLQCALLRFTHCYVFTYHGFKSVDFSSMQKRTHNGNDCCIYMFGNNFYLKIPDRNYRKNSKFSGCSESRNKIVLSRYWLTIKLPMILFIKKIPLPPLPPFWKNRKGNATWCPCSPAALVSQYNHLFVNLVQQSTMTWAWVWKKTIKVKKFKEISIVTQKCFHSVKDSSPKQNCMYSHVEVLFQLHTQGLKKKGFAPKGSLKTNAPHPRDASSIFAAFFWLGQKAMSSDHESAQLNLLICL